MRCTIEFTDKIYYNGENQREIHSFFKKWEEKWNFRTTLFTRQYGSYFNWKKYGYCEADLYINYNDCVKGGPMRVPKGTWLRFAKLDGGEKIFIYEKG